MTTTTHDLGDNGPRLPEVEQGDIDCPSTDIKDLICEWMQEYIDAGEDAQTAGRQTLQRVLQAGLIGAAVDRFGARWIASVWREYYVAPGAGREGMWKLTRGRAPASPEPGGRRIDLTLLRDEEASVLETLWFVDNAWVRLGDLVKYQCRTLADRYLQLAENATKKAEFFDELATKLPKEKSVRVAFSEDRLRAMLVELGA